MSDPAGKPFSSAVSPDDPERDAIVRDESELLDRTHHALALATRRVVQDYDQELLSLRDQIAEARLEDVPPLIQQMERLQLVAARRSEIPTVAIDARSPYFGHVRLEEKSRQRDVLIGNATYIDMDRNVRIVDWRDAPVSQIYYRYGEGDDYEEEIAGRTLEGHVQVRRSLVIVDGTLRRVVSPQGVFARQRQGSDLSWRRLDVSASKLAGGQGTAERPPPLEEYSIRRGRLGVGVAGREDRHLPEIPALIDRRQFELIARPTSGLVVIQGGAGSGKTTIGLHRLAYLAFQDPRRFAPDKMLVVVFNDALAAYISRVLPGLRVEGVQVITFADWAARQRARHVPRLPREYSEDTPIVVTRLKKHPALMTLIDERIEREVEAIGKQLLEDTRATSRASDVRMAWENLAQYVVAQRIAAMQQWCRGEREIAELDGRSLAMDTRLALTAALARAVPRARDVVWDWAEMLTDTRALTEGLGRLAPGAFTASDIAMVVRWSSDRAAQMHDEVRGESGAHDPTETLAERSPTRRSSKATDRDLLDEVSGAADRDRERDDDDLENATDRDDDGDGYRAIDGVDERQRLPVVLDREDDALLLRFYQRKRGPLRRDRKTALLYEHVFVDEAQDLAPIELATFLDCVTPARSITLAGDTAQRLLMDNGFTDWQDVLARLGHAGIQVEPLRIGYRSTLEVMEFARHVLGPLADPEAPVATRSGAPVEMHRFPDVGAAVAFLGESLRMLGIDEARSSVAVIARDPERADLYHRGLERAEVPRLSRVRAQDFSFRPGVEVTDIRQVKGLEFDYVIMVDVTAAQYPVNDESRHLLHIGATRAAHQLWLVAVGEPSKLLPDAMRD